jgi:large subunit ribosomal protein L31
MKPEIHPTYVSTTVVCTCGATFTTRSTAPNGRINADVCSECHPFYTGKQKILDTGGRVARFQARYANRGQAAKGGAAKDGAARGGAAKKAASTTTEAT